MSKLIIEKIVPTNFAEFTDSVVDHINQYSPISVTHNKVLRGQSTIAVLLNWEGTVVSLTHGPAAYRPDTLSHKHIVEAIGNDKQVDELLVSLHVADEDLVNYDKIADYIVKALLT